MNQRRTLAILDARAAHSAWSKRKMLFGIVAALVTAMLAHPVAAHATELQTLKEPEAIVAAVDTDANETNAKEDEQATAVGEMSAAADDATAAPGNASEIPAGEAPKVEEQPSGTEKSPEAETGNAGKTDPKAGDEAKQPGAPEKQSETPSEPAKPVEKPESVIDKASKHAADKLGTKIIFDFNGDGKTDAEDWKAYLKWMSEFRPFDFDLETGDLGDSHNGGVQITGATQIIANGSNTSRTLDSIDTNLDVTKITRYYLNNVKQATSVKNQSPFGTCWSFASISALESAILKAQAGDKATVVNPNDHLKPILSKIDDKGVDYSELYLAWMAFSLQEAGSQKGEGEKDILPGDLDHDRLQAGGWATMAETLFTAWQSIATEQEVPYWPKGVPVTFENFLKIARMGPKWKPNPKSINNKVRVKGVYYLPDPNILELDKKDHLVWKGYNKNANKIIKEALVKYGAVQIGYGADSAQPGAHPTSDYFNANTWAQYCDATNIEITHAVTIVGWDDDFDPANFQADSNNIKGLKKGAWLVKNSWGSGDWFTKNFGLDPSSLYNNPRVRKWGIIDPETGLHTGYFWLSYYDHSINTPSVYEVELADENGKFQHDHNYNYDTAINQSQAPFVFRTKDSGTWVSNVFKAKGKEILKAVTVHTSTANSKVKIRIYLVNANDLKDNNPTNDCKPVLEMDYKAILAGAHTVELSKYIQLKPGQLFAIVENIVSPEDGSSLINLETGMAQSAQYPYPAGAKTTGEESKGRAMGYIWTNIVANPGETFIKMMTNRGYLWMTPQQLSECYMGGNVFEFGNALIKALTADGTLPTPPAPAKPEKVKPIVAHTEDANGKHVRHAIASHTSALPQTGDTANGVPFALLALGSALAAAGVLVKKDSEA